MNVAVKPSEVTCPVILAPALFFRINVEVVTLVPSTFSLNASFNYRSSSNTSSAASWAGTCDSRWRGV